VLRKDDDDDWVKKCMEYEGSKAKRKTKEDLERGCPERTVKRKMIKDV